MNQSLMQTPSPTLADQIENMGRALTADDLAKFFSVTSQTIYNGVKAGRIPNFRIGSCVRFCPRTIADWLRNQ